MMINLSQESTSNSKYLKKRWNPFELPEKYLKSGQKIFLFSFYFD